MATLGSALAPRELWCSPGPGRQHLPTLVTTVQWDMLAGRSSPWTGPCPTAVLSATWEAPPLHGTVEAAVQVYLGCSGPGISGFEPCKGQL